MSLHSKTQISDLVTLSIHNVVLGDAGKYQCQVSAQDKISRSLELVVVTPQVGELVKLLLRKINDVWLQVKILGGQDIHVKEGSAVVLKCVITNIVEKPPFVTWYLNNKVGGKRIVLKLGGCAGEMITNDFYRKPSLDQFQF